MADRSRRRHETEARALAVAAERLDHERAARVGVSRPRRSRERPRRLVFTASGRDDAHVATGEDDIDRAAIGGRGLEQRRGGFTAEQIGQRRRVHQSPHDRIVRVGG